jgi:hypothetical protein
MTVALYTSTRLPTIILACKDGEWFAIPNTVTSPEVAWGQRRPMPAQDTRFLTPIPDHALYARMMQPAIGGAIMTGQELAAAIKSLGLPRDVFAHHVGYTKSIVDKWCAGSVEVNTAVARYARALLVTGYRPADWPARNPSPE